MKIFGLYLPITVTIITLSISTLSKGHRTMIRRGVTPQDRERVLRIHNEYRAEVAEGKVEDQPRATNMKELCWDDKLAEVAQNIADKMQYHYETVYDGRWSHVGQNMAMQSAVVKNPGTYWRTAIKSWFVEVNDYNFSDMPRGATRRYTQLVWAKTTHIGCGFVFFIDDTQEAKYKMLYVCNYGPGGNLYEMTPYLTGPEGCKGLCKTKCTR